MKILVDFEKAMQEWNPSTGRQRNFLVLNFAGTRFEVDVSEGALTRFVAEAMKHGEVADIPDDDQLVYGPGEESPLDIFDAPLEEAVYDAVDHSQPRLEGGSEEIVFGGDFAETVVPPNLFNTDDLPSEEEEVVEAPLSPTQQRKLTIAQTTAREADGPRDRLKQMRARARELPPRRVGADEAGYPDSSQVKAIAKRAKAAQRQLRVAGGPEVAETDVAPELDGDEDGFEQG